MPYSIKHILSAIALLLAVFGLIWPNYPLTTVAVVLLAVSNFTP
jgi:hypothetical protein